jgi:RpiR family carbohydrate utilization transcriptional regulator
MRRVDIREQVDNRPSFGLLAQLRHGGGNSSQSTRKIAQVILGNPAVAAMETLTELAERAEVSDSSIVRFVRQQGYKSFQEFKVALAFDAAQEAAKLSGSPASGQGEDFLSVLLAQSTSALEQTCLYLDAGHIRDLAKRLLRADQVLLAGAGTSGVIAVEYSYKLLRLGVRVTELRDLHMAAMQATLLGKNSVLVAISRSGATIDVLRILDIARERGATSILVTSKPKSTGARSADHVLLAVGSESPIEGGSLNFDISAIFVLNAIHAALLEAVPNASALLLRTAQAISGTRE